ncbi:MAG: hypothetical protein V1876_00460 [Candidatus Peregrinibacteria bacterium]
MPPSESPKERKPLSPSDWLANIAIHRKEDFDRLCHRCTTDLDAVGKKMQEALGSVRQAVEKIGLPAGTAEDMQAAGQKLEKLRARFQEKTGQKPGTETDTQFIRVFALIHAIANRGLSALQERERKASALQTGDGAASTAPQEILHTPPEQEDIPLAEEPSDYAVDLEEIIGDSSPPKRKTK